MGYMGYFGAWRGFPISHERLGPVRGVVPGIPAALGLIAIAAAGVVAIRAMRRMQAAGRSQGETRRPV